MTIQPHWQSLLFVPVGADRHLDSAIRHRPDAVILDLEDAIAADAKEAARARIGEFQARLADAAIACIVRVNASLAMMAADIAALNGARCDALLLPKCEDERSVLNAAELLGEGKGILALIETPAGVGAIDRIAALPATCGLMLGSEDLSAALGVDPDRGALHMPCARIAMAAAQRGLLAIGFPGSIANFRDLESYRNRIAMGRDLGMNAVAAIHPAQLPVIREVLAPTEREVGWARSVIAAMAGHDGAVAAVDDMMIDAPVVARAQRLLAAHQRMTDA